MYSNNVLNKKKLNEIKYKMDFISMKLLYFSALVKIRNKKAANRENSFKFSNGWVVRFSYASSIQIFQWKKLKKS